MLQCELNMVCIHRETIHRALLASVLVVSADEVQDVTRGVVGVERGGKITPHEPPGGGGGRMLGHCEGRTDRDPA